VCVAIVPDPERSWLELSEVEKSVGASPFPMLTMFPSASVRTNGQYSMDDPLTQACLGQATGQQTIKISESQ
jgi:hypothetical protein